MKETFIIRTEWIAAIEQLDPKDQATIFINLFRYHSGRENLINLNNLQVKLVWALIEPNLKYNVESYDRRRDTSRENGKRGGRPEKNLNKPNNNLNNQTVVLDKTQKPNETLSVIVTDTVTDIGTDFKSENSENFNYDTIPAQMLQEFLEIFYIENPEYIRDRNLDIRPAREIYSFLKSKGMSYEEIKTYWRELAKKRHNHTFYSKLPLKVLSSQIQGLIEARDEVGKIDKFKKWNLG